MKQCSHASKKPRGKDRAHEPTPFAIRLFRGRWQVKQGRNWRNAREVAILAPAICTPAGEICGSGVVSRSGVVFRVTS